MFVNTNKAIAKINSQSWTLIDDGIRDAAWAKIKNNRVHVIHQYYDEDGFFSREVHVGDTYEQAIASKEVLSHWETFTPDLSYLFDEDD